MTDTQQPVPPIPVDPLVPPPPSNAAVPAAETVAQAVDRAEAAATRRRWVTLAELVGVAGVIIAAFGLWLTWSDRRADDQAKQAEQAEQASERKTRTLVMLKAAVDGDGLSLSDPGHDVQTIDISFPKALGVAAKTDADPQIEAGWVSAPMLKLTDGGPDTQSGRLPVLITARYWDADVERHDAALYDVVWKTEGRFMQGRAFKLEGLKLKERTASVAQLEAVWAREKPKAGK